MYKFYSFFFRTFLVPWGQQVFSILCQIIPETIKRLNFSMSLDRYITLLTQIRNIRKTILRTQKPLTISRVGLETAPTQGASWLLHDDNADTQLTAGVLIPLIFLRSLLRKHIPGSDQSFRYLELHCLSSIDEPCCSSSCWSAPPTWSSTTLPWSVHKYSSLIPLLISKSTNFNQSYANISKLSFF